MERSATELKSFQEKFLIPQLTVAHTNSWVLSVRPEQITYGSTVISSRLGKMSLSELTPEEGGELTSLLGKIENIMCESYKAERLNVLCLMMVDPVVHFHVIPRYSKPLNMHGLDWVDADYPAPVQIRPAPTSMTSLTEIVSELSGKLLDT